MLSFSYFVENVMEDDNDLSFIDFLLENYDDMETFDDVAELAESDYAPPVSTAIGAIKEDINKHMEAHMAMSPREKSAAYQEAKAHFKNKDFRTAKEKISGQRARKDRFAKNAKLPKNKQINQTNFETPLKLSGKITTATDKHLSSGTGYRIPKGFSNAGKGATVSALRLTPGTANLGDGKMFKSCAKATTGCGGSGTPGEAGVGKDALCLATRANDAFVNSRKSKLARTRAFFSNPEDRKHATIMLSHELHNATQRAASMGAVHHFRPNDSSDVDLVTSAVNKHHPEVITYGYSKHMKHDTENPNNHVTRSDTGPEFNENGLQDKELRDAKNKTIAHLSGGNNTRAYMVMAQKRKRADIGTEKDVTTSIHTVRYHKYDEEGNHIGHEDFDADRNVKNGDLRPYDKKPERNLKTAEGKEKGAVTITDISSGFNKDIKGKKGESTPNTMVHPIDDEHVTPDPENPGKHIYHVDPPSSRRKVFGMSPEGY